MSRTSISRSISGGLAATAGLGFLAATAHADFVGLSGSGALVSQEGWQAPDARTLVLVSLYAEFDAATDRLIAVYGDATDPMTITTSDDDGFWQFDADGSQDASLCNTSSGISAALMAAYPSQASDSFVTIGLTTNTDNAIQDIGIDFDGFNTGVPTWTIDSDNGTFFCTPSDDQTLAGNYTGHKVLIGQFAVAEGESVSGSVNIQWNNDAGDTTRELATAFNVSAVETATADVRNDLNGDGYSDLLLRNPNADGGSDLLAWLYDGSNPSAVTRAYTDYIYNGSAQLQTWEFVAVDDFNGDGIDEPMFRTPANRFYVLNASYDGAGNITVGLDTVHSGGGYATWTALGTGDFNGDGLADVLLRNPIDDGGSDLVVWFMNAANPSNITKAAADNIYNGSSQLSSFEFLGVGDGNADGVADMFWRTPANRFYCFRTNIITDTNVSTSLDTLHAGGGYQTWDFSSLADVNGDGSTDVILRSPVGDGASDFLAFKLTNASPSNIVKSNDMIYNGSNGQIDWTVVGLGDFTGDGSEDMVMRTPSNRFYLWPTSGDANVSIGAAQTLHSGSGYSDWGVLAPSGEVVP
ncbi:MAG: VCBS repeat-containing protein [Phycisphaerales bacterium]|jgi:hypothetical protein|nr:VCBS repeat-containing protein [Phycisphaerales bacterium]